VKYSTWPTYGRPTQSNTKNGGRLPCSHPNAVKAFQNDILKSSIDLIDCMMRGKPAERHIAATNAARRAGGHTPGDHHPWWNTPLGKACEEALNA
jgi:hypothetical protein